MDDCYLKIMKQLNYDVPTAKTLVDLCRGSHGDYSDMGFKYIIDAAKTVSHLDFKSNILLLSDRLYGVAIGMHYFFRRCTDADVECAMYDGQDVLSAINSRDIDFLILAGYLRTEVNKEILAKIREQKKLLKL